MSAPLTRDEIFFNICMDTGSIHKGNSKIGRSQVEECMEQYAAQQTAALREELDVQTNFAKSEKALREQSERLYNAEHTELEEMKEARRIDTDNLLSAYRERDEAKSELEAVKRGKWKEGGITLLKSEDHQALIKELEALREELFVKDSVIASATVYEEKLREELEAVKKAYQVKDLECAGYAEHNEDLRAELSEAADLLKQVDKIGDKLPGDDKGNLSYQIHRFVSSYEDKQNATPKSDTGE